VAVGEETDRRDGEDDGEHRVIDAALAGSGKSIATISLMRPGLAIELASGERIRADFNAAAATGKASAAKTADGRRGCTGANIAR
jgi:hypothetical protein